MHSSLSTLKTGIIDPTGPYRARLTYDAGIPWPGSMFMDNLEKYKYFLQQYFGSNDCFKHQQEGIIGSLLYLGPY